MTNYKIKKYKGLKVFYTEELDGGGTTFGQDYLSFILILAAAGYAGAYLGRRLISSIPFDSFNIALKVLLTFLSIFLII